MKKLLLPLFCMLLAFSSCKRCRDCSTEITTTIKEPGQPTKTEPIITKNEGQLCGDDLKAMEDRDVTSEGTHGDSTIYTRKLTTCK